MPLAPTAGFNPKLEALKTKPEGVEVVSVRLTGDELGTWNELRSAHPKMSNSELFKEAIKLRYVADLCRADGTGLFLKRPGTNELTEVLDLLGYSRAGVLHAVPANSVIEEERPAKQPAEPKPADAKSQKASPTARQKSARKGAANKSKPSAVTT